MATRSGTNAALVVVDVQAGVVATAWDRDRIVANIARAVERARAAGVPVIWVQHEDDDLPRDSVDWKWVPELQATPGELWIHKHFNSSFEDTALLAELDRLGVSRLFLAGAATNWCIRATAYGALERGFDLTLLSDAHTTKDLALAPGRVVPAQVVIDDLNTVMQWLGYPGRTNAAVPVAEAVFG
ncbi:isochorismatase family protein [Uliginosibacterium paludis]|uniref:Isochorismatase family protein n=1 Tax=Uliginosibacterium paludis TaxID=1615952 RepID=A0ABV2CUE5_9RHOO